MRQKANVEVFVKLENKQNISLEYTRRSDETFVLTNNASIHVSPTFHAHPEGRLDLSDVYPLFGISGLSSDSSLLSPLLLFC